ncbi:DUF4402 domain-containing protein [Parasphingorhabdus sp.]
MRRAMLVTALPLAALCSAGPLAAASNSSDSKVSVRKSVTLSKTSDLMFGDFAAGTTRSIFRLNPRTGALVQRSGDAVSLGGTQSLASFDVTGTARLRVQISTGQNRIFIVRDGGAERMRINRFRFDRRRKRLNAAGERTFNIGGQLRIGANQRAGVYRGSFEVSVDYF